MQQVFIVFLLLLYVVFVKSIIFAARNNHTMNHPFRILPIIMKARRPSRITDMPAVRDAFWLKKGYTAMTFFGHIITHSAEEANQLNMLSGKEPNGKTPKPLHTFCALKNHEMIHLRQAQACGDSWLRFYWRYLRYWLQGIRLNRQLRNAGYLLNPFEMEAYEHMDDAQYLDHCPDGATGWKHYAAMSATQRLEHYKGKQTLKNIEYDKENAGA